MSSSSIHPLARRFIEDAGHATQSFGFGRVVGQLYAFLYFSSAPRNLAHMQAALGISKGSASTAVRQLEQWGAVRKVWVKGDRKDYYEASDWFGRILKKAVADTVGKKMGALTALLEEVDATLAEIPEGENGDGAFIRDRVRRLKEFHGKARAAWEHPLVAALLEK